MHPACLLSLLEFMLDVAKTRNVQAVVSVCKAHYMFPSNVNIVRKGQSFIVYFQGHKEAEVSGRSYVDMQQSINEIKRTKVVG